MSGPMQTWPMIREMAARQLQQGYSHPATLANKPLSKSMVCQDLCHHMAQLGHNELIHFEHYYIQVYIHLLSDVIRLCEKNSVIFQVWLELTHLRPRQADDIFKGIFLNEIVWIIKIWQKVQLKIFQRWLINTMMVILLTHICATRPQWVKSLCWLKLFGTMDRGCHFSVN